MAQAVLSAGEAVRRCAGEMQAGWGQAQGREVAQMGRASGTGLDASRSQ